nr:hypothetical protein [Microbacterium bovistercoris]
MNAGTAVEVQMVAIPHQSTTPQGVAVQPYNTITGNCGTAFLWASNAHDHVHFDVGAYNMPNGNFYISAQVGDINTSGGGTAYVPYSTWGVSSSWERQGNLYAGRWTNEVSAYIKSTGVLYDCESLGLAETVVVY